MVHSRNTISNIRYVANFRVAIRYRYNLHARFSVTFRASEIFVRYRVAREVVKPLPAQSFLYMVVDPRTHHCKSHFYRCAFCGSYEIAHYSIIRMYNVVLMTNQNDIRDNRTC